MRCLGALLVSVLLACGPKQPTPAPTPPPPPAKELEGTLDLEVEPPDAEVEIDGAPRGPASGHKSLTLAHGAHQIVIKKPGFEIWRGEVEIKEQPEKIQVKLVPLKR